VEDGEYIEKLRGVFLQRHGCKSSWVESVPVHDVFGGKTIWKGFVDVFSLTGNLKSKKAYARMGQEGMPPAIGLKPNWKFSPLSHP
jgi:hypothetical protein